MKAPKHKPMKLMIDLINHSDFINLKINQKMLHDCHVRVGLPFLRSCEVCDDDYNLLLHQYVQGQQKTPKAHKQKS